jgi:ubiquinone biosynthesis protein UbiJ
MTPTEFARVLIAVAELREAVTDLTTRVERLEKQPMTVETAA